MSRRQVVVKIAAGLVACGVLLLAGLLFWPAPRGWRPLRCQSSDPPGCRAASGRVLWAVRSDRRDPNRPLHLALISRDSVAFPLVTAVKIPTYLRPAHVPGFGRWVSVVGSPVHGSQGETDLHVTRIRL